MKKLKPADRLAAELEKIISEAQTVLAEYRAATQKAARRKPVVFRDPRTGKSKRVRR